MTNSAQNQKQLLSKLIDEINADFTPKGSHKPIAATGDDFDYVKAIPTFSPTLDYVLGIGGWPEGKLIEIFGREHCLDANTHISYNIKDSSRKIRNSKGGTIEDLYYIFNKITRNDNGNYRRSVTDDAIFTAPSIDDNGHIFHNQIVGVIDSGVQECFRMTTECGESIEATSQHKFFTGDKYSRLENLSIGDTIYVHNNTHFKKENLKNVAVSATIKSIEFVGERQTYDVQMLSPYNNFVANRFVVHNSGKSTMAILALKDCYDYYKGEKLVAYIDVEHRFNKEWAEKLGFVVDQNMTLIQPADAESATDIMTRLIKSDLYCAIVWDSIGAAATTYSQQELTDKKDRIGGNASVMKRCVQTNGPLADLYDVTIFMINQLRDDITGYHQLVRPGGHAVKHQMSVVLYLRPGTEKYFDKVNGEDLQVGFPIMIKTLKNSYGPPLIQGWTDFYNQPSQYLDHVGIDYNNDLFRIGTLLGVVKKAGSWFSWKEFKEQGSAKLLKAVIESNREGELLADIRSAIQEGRKRDRDLEQELENEFGKKFFEGPDINDPEI
jgi:recombination protein RecA